MSDWHDTQNEKYLELAAQRLIESKLIWVDQFVEIINREIANNFFDLKKSISINDFGCNVGHFIRGIDSVLCAVEYNGYDISDIYLNVAKKRFGNEFFHYLDISTPVKSIALKKADISVISATLEHIENFECALNNIFSFTTNLVVLRTFIGNDELVEFCKTVGAKKSYLIRQFTERQLIKIPKDLGWSYSQECDLATNGEPKMVCNANSLLRKQSVFIFKKLN